MKHTFLNLMAICGLALLSSNAMAADTAKTTTKPVSKISDVKAMPDDTEVVIQGVIVQSLGDENYLVKDDSGTVNIEIDEDLVQGNTITPEAEVLITATVDQEGNVTSLEAEEVQFVPANAPTAVNKSAN
ncbi:MAG: YgiW/YdeI family stress tolerance OB fold protein [Alphaproteobacteria bacterium]|nr:NirD/YgiW/YdeI family stress tolerance protein [Alphaproteobacteria bacterium]MDY4689603.1 NirD/YgiW/YdeI family stress tolerance protein [Alphaproteobacteria bacterium]